MCNCTLVQSAAAHVVAAAADVVVDVAITAVYVTDVIVAAAAVVYVNTRPSTPKSGHFEKSILVLQTYRDPISK